MVDGVIAAQKNDKWGVIGWDNNVIIDFIYENDYLAWSRNKGFIPAKLGGKWGIIDKQGRTLKIQVPQMSKENLMESLYGGKILFKYKEKNSVKYGLNPTKEELAWHIDNATLKDLKGFLTTDDDLYIWDKVLWVHNEVSRRLKIDGIRFDIEHFGGDYAIRPRSDRDRAKLSTSPRVQALGLAVL